MARKGLEEEGSLGRQSKGPALGVHAGEEAWNQGGLGQEMSLTRPHRTHRTPRMRRQKWARLEITMTPTLALL